MFRTLSSYLGNVFAVMHGKLDICLQHTEQSVVWHLHLPTCALFLALLNCTSQKQTMRQKMLIAIKSPMPDMLLLKSPMPAALPKWLPNRRLIGSHNMWQRAPSLKAKGAHRHRKK
ncbi:hypothetical protein FKM82_012599 [Ascaphus truei]